MTDRELLEWVAQAEVGTVLPEGFNMARLQVVLQDIGYPRATEHDVVDGPDISQYVRGWLEREQRELPKP